MQYDYKVQFWGALQRLSTFLFSPVNAYSKSLRSEGFASFQFAPQPLFPGKYIHSTETTDLWTGPEAKDGFPAREEDEDLGKVIQA